MTYINDNYGVSETNPLVGDNPDWEETVDLDDSRLSRITRLRLVSDPGFPMWDVSYCYGVLHDGTPVRVMLGESQFRRGRGAPSLTSQLVALAKSQGVYAKGIGLIDPGVISTLI